LLAAGRYPGAHRLGELPVQVVALGVRRLRAPTEPTSTRDPSRSASTYTVDSVVPDSESRSSPRVVATRRCPSHSLIAYWLINQPSTAPEPTYRGVPGPEVSNLWISVRSSTSGSLGPPPRSSTGSSGSSQRCQSSCQRRSCAR